MKAIENASRFRNNKLENEQQELCKSDNIIASEKLNYYSHSHIMKVQLCRS